MKLRVLALAIALLLLGACGGKGRIESLSGVKVTLGSGSTTLTIVAKVAATPQARAEGLMGIKSLPANRGMLFLFREPVRVSFYMKDTLIPLDIAFIGQGKVLQIESMVPCKVEKCPLTKPSATYEMALEVAAGTFARAGIAPAATVSIEGTLPRAS
jgi:uncharacterized protein